MTKQPFVPFDRNGGTLTKQPFVPFVRVDNVALAKAYCDAHPVRLELKRGSGGVWRTQACDSPTCQAPRCILARRRGKVTRTIGGDVPRAFVHEPSPGVTWLTVTVFAALLAFVFVDVWFRFMGMVTR